MLCLSILCLLNTPRKIFMLYIPMIAGYMVANAVIVSSLTLVMFPYLAVTLSASK